MPEEDDVRERDENDFLGERVLERVNGALDEFRAVVEGLDGHAGRKARLDLADFFLHAVDSSECVLAVAHHDDAADHFATVHVERAASEVAADLHGCDVFKINGNAAALDQHDVLQVRERLHEAEAAHDEFHAVLLDNLAADVEVARADGVHHVFQRDLARAHLERTDFNLILSHEAADARDFRDPLHGVELVTDEPVLEGAQLAQVVSQCGMRCVECGI